MAFNISGFRSALRLDGARPNLFEVTMPFPTIIPGGGAATRDLTFMCRTAQLPGSTIGSVVVPYFGREVKLAGNRTFADWTVTIINDENFSVRNAFERWLSAINSHDGNLRNGSFQTPTSYTVNATVTQFGKAGARLKSYEFLGLFPIDMAGIDVDWGSNDALEEFTVTFQYQLWRANGRDSGNTTDVPARFDAGSAA